MRHKLPHSVGSRYVHLSMRCLKHKRCVVDKPLNIQQPKKQCECMMFNRNRNRAYQQNIRVRKGVGAPRQCSRVNKNEVAVSSILSDVQYASRDGTASSPTRTLCQRRASTPPVIRTIRRLRRHRHPLRVRVRQQTLAGLLLCFHNIIYIYINIRRTSYLSAFIIYLSARQHDKLKAVELDGVSSCR